MSTFQRWGALRQRVRATRTGRLTLRIGVGTVGTLIVLIGLILVPLPGPGWLIVLGGLAVLAAEFAWARNLLEFTRRQLEGWWRWLRRQRWSVRVLVGLSGILLIAALMCVAAAISFDVRTPGQLWGRLH
jgi:uncharacterized protein (TIGR02611 family)